MMCPDPVTEVLERLWDDWSVPPSPHYIFLAIDIESDVLVCGSAELLGTERLVLEEREFPPVKRFGERSVGIGAR